MRWIKEILRDAGIDTNTDTSHSSRAAATSYGFEKGTRIAEILDAAGSSDARTFASYYQKPVVRHTRNEYYASLRAGHGAKSGIEHT